MTYTLSAKHGLLPLNRLVEPYDEVLPTTTDDLQQLRWAQQVLADLQERHGPSLRGAIFEMHARRPYIAHLQPLLEAAGAICVSPAAGMSQPECLRFYAAASRSPAKQTVPAPVAAAQEPGRESDRPPAPTPPATVAATGAPSAAGRSPVRVHVQVWLAAALLHEAGLAICTASDLLEEVIRRFGDAGPGTAVHTLAHCVANDPKHAAAEFSYLTRTETGEYRLYHTGDELHPSRSGMRTAPDEAEVPPRYYDVWSRWSLQQRRKA